MIDIQTFHESISLSPTVFKKYYVQNKFRFIYLKLFKKFAISTFVEIRLHESQLNCVFPQYEIFFNQFFAVFRMNFFFIY